MPKILYSMACPGCFPGPSPACLARFYFGSNAPFHLHVELCTNHRLRRGRFRHRRTQNAPALLQNLLGKLSYSRKPSPVMSCIHSALPVIGETPRPSCTDGSNPVQTCLRLVIIMFYLFTLRVPRVLILMAHVWVGYG